MKAPIVVVNTNTKREHARKTQLSNILAAKTVADVVRSCLGPASMLKMIMDPMGGIVLTNDGNAILREIEVAHPAAKSMIELSRTQDEEVGDGTTSVVVLAGELLAVCSKYLEKGIHPVVIIAGLRQALGDGLRIMNGLAVPVDINDTARMTEIVRGSINTKFAGQWAELMCKLALGAVQVVAVVGPDGLADVDVKRFVRIEKVPGEISSSEVLSGVMLNKDITHPQMKRRIENPRIVVLDCSLEYKKGESQTNLELTREQDWTRVQEIEEEQIKDLCDKIVSLRPDLVITEKGVSDLAQHYFVKANIAAIRRVRKTDLHRVCRAVGARIVNRVDDLKEEDMGTRCNLFHIEKIGDEYFAFLECRRPKACSILLRGPSKEILNELERDLQDALCVAKNIYCDPKLVPGGGAIEMAVSSLLGVEKTNQLAKLAILGSDQSKHLVVGVYQSVAESLEVVPRTLVSNCGGNVIKTLAELRAKHSSQMHNFGVDGITGRVADMERPGGIWEPLIVKTQTLKTAVEAACMILKVDNMIPGVSKKKSHTQPEMSED